jgi:amidase
MAALHDLTMLEQAAAIRGGEVSPVELVEHYLGRIDRLNDTVGAFVHVAPDLALAAAKEAERALSGGDELPPLHGVPTGIKDLYLTADMPTSFGSGAVAPVDLGIDEFVVTQIRRSGQISLGKTNTPELGAPCYTEPDNAPPARTPWDLDRSAGGSSGGAAAAVAAGLLPAAPGSDGGGSIRIPASVNGLFGVKTSRGRISRACPCTARSRAPSAMPRRCSTRWRGRRRRTGCGPRRPTAAPSWRPATRSPGGCGSAATSPRSSSRMPTSIPTASRPTSTRRSC